MGFFKDIPPEQRMQRSDLSIDIETLGTKPGAAILSIGAVIFDPLYQNDFDVLRERAFYRNIQPEDAEAQGLERDPDTEAWWARQSDEARAVLAYDQVPLSQALTEFVGYITNHYYPIGGVWGKGPSFDCVLLQAAMRATGHRCPWPFWMERCVRTIQDMAYPEGDLPRFFGSGGVAHDARDDSVAQALMVQSGFLRLGLSVPAEHQYVS